jgi:hypothetical protein
MGIAARGIHHFVSPEQRSRTIDAAQRILAQGGWCVLEVCVDVRGQLWEPHALLFDLVADVVADVVEDEVSGEPHLDARLTGYNRTTLQPDPAMGAFLCYVAERPLEPAVRVAL